MVRMRLLAALYLVLPAHALLAQDFSGDVVAIQDGDSLTVLVGKRQVKVRLTEIDAPERKQAFGTASRQSLGEICFRRNAVVRNHGTDRYKRTLGRVFCNGVDANQDQVRRGMAWVFDRYVTDRSLYNVQEEARTAGRGLWADSRPIPPWEWRAAKRRGEVKTRGQRESDQAR